jgi:hypothetical protein
MLKFENIKPSNLAYDRPSPKLIAFLKKHYSLINFTPQNNNFVVFNEYFTDVKFIFLIYFLFRILIDPQDQNRILHLAILLILRIILIIII